MGLIGNPVGSLDRIGSGPAAVTGDETSTKPLVVTTGKAGGVG